MVMSTAIVSMSFLQWYSSDRSTGSALQFCLINVISTLIVLHDL